MREDLERRVEFLKFTRIHFISALQGSGVGDVFKSINKAYTSAFIDLSTPRLTRMLEVVTTQHQPPMVNGRRIKLRYAHQGGQNPPVIVIHGKQALKVPQSYQRYLMNHFIKALRLFGTPLRIEFRQDDNPFHDNRRVKPGRKQSSARSVKGKKGSDSKQRKSPSRGESKLAGDDSKAQVKRGRSKHRGTGGRNSTPGAKQSSGENKTR